MSSLPQSSLEKSCKKVSQDSMPDEKIQTEVILTMNKVQGRDLFDKYNIHSPMGPAGCI